jgi:GT2 family glycosyltransferase
VHSGDQGNVWAVVLMYGGADITAACIESLLAQDYPTSVLLVDNASHDGGGAILRSRFPAIHYLDAGGNTGYTGGNNRGIAHALAHGADFLFIVNNDTVVEPSCVRMLVAAVEDDVALVCPKILCFSDPTRLWYAGGDFLPHKAIGEHRDFLAVDSGQLDARARVTFATGCALLMPARVARRIGGFAEDYFMYAEDVELSLRVQRMGYGIVYEPGARVLHRDDGMAQPTPFQIRHRDRNRRRLVRQHYGLRDRLAFALWFYPTRVLRVAQYAARADFARARAVVDGMLER